MSDTCDFHLKCGTPCEHDLNNKISSLKAEVAQLAGELAAAKQGELQKLTHLNDRIIELEAALERAREALETISNDSRCGCRSSHVENWHSNSCWRRKAIEVLAYLPAPSSEAKSC